MASSTIDWTGNRSRTVRRVSSTPKSCRRRTKTLSMAVPETTPSWPAVETARASGQPETAMPIPPWINQGVFLAQSEATSTIFRSFRCQANVSR